MNRLYYCNRTFCNYHNQRTKALKEYLQQFNATLFVFDDKFTTEDFLSTLEEKLAELNKVGRSREIKVRLAKFDTIHYSFYDKPDSGEPVAGITLCPVERVISSND